MEASLEQHSLTVKGENPEVQKHSQAVHSGRQPSDHSNSEADKAIGR